MSNLTSKGRNHLPDSAFGFPEERKYPIENKSHAINAKARATQEYNKGHLTKAQGERIDRKANHVLHGEHGMKEHQQSHWG